MNATEFLDLATEKLGPEMAASLVSQANIAAIHQVLISKGLVTKEEFEETMAKQFEVLVRNLDKIKGLT